MKENLHQQLREADNRRKHFWRGREQAKQAWDSAYRDYYAGEIDRTEYEEVGRQYRKACLTYEMAVLAHKLLLAELAVKSSRQ